MPLVVATACYSGCGTTPKGSSSPAHGRKKNDAKSIPERLVILFRHDPGTEPPSIFVLRDHLHLTQPHRTSASKRVLKHPRRRPALNARSHSLMLTPVQSPFLASCAFPGSGSNDENRRLPPANQPANRVRNQLPRRSPCRIFANIRPRNLK
jgi:hypothetical protein